MSKEEIEKAKKLLGWVNLNKFYIDVHGEVDYHKVHYSIETLLQYIDQLENQIEATEMEHKYDVNMIDEVKGESVKLYKEIRKQNKIINEMADVIVSDEKILALTCKHIIKKTDDECEKQNLLCNDCIKQYFEKKVEEK